MLTPIDVVIYLCTSNHNPLYVFVDEYLQWISNRDHKIIHGIIHSNINYVTDQEVSH